MAPRRKFSRRGGRKRKWRQQKLAVGTVQRIAKEIAQREDQKAIVKYCHQSYLKQTTFGWTNIASLPSSDNWAQVKGEEIYSVLASDLGGHLHANNLVQTSGTDRGKLELRVHGVEAFGICHNDTTVPVRFEARLIYVPNLNDKTVNVADDLVPRFSQFFKSGAGLGTLKYQGYARRQLAMLGDTDDNGRPIKFVTLDRKVMHLAPGRITGSVDLDGQPGDIDIFQPTIYKRFTLRKRFKMPGKRAYVRPEDAMLTNGNYYTVCWCDLEDAENVNIQVLIAQNLQYSLKAPMMSDGSTQT